MKIQLLALLLLIGCTNEETLVPLPSPVSTNIKECVTLNAEKYSKQFSELVCALKSYKHNPPLKGITLAQWILESGRGNSDLAKNHYNFGGLKWRKEMEGYGTPVSYKAHDGRTEYVKFQTPLNFIEGYWKFISRSPYKGWEEFKDDPHGYIEFINRKGYTPPLSYYKRVIELEKEALILLKED